MRKLCKLRLSIQGHFRTARPTAHYFYPHVDCRVVPLKLDEDYLLRKSLKFSLPTVNHSKALKVLVSDLACGICVHEQCAQLLINELYLCVKNRLIGPINRIKKKITANDLIIRKANKANTVIVLRNVDNNN